MNITEVRITLRDEEKLKCFANVTFDACFVVRGVKVIQGTEGYFVSMPSRKREDGTFLDIAHPINMEMRQRLDEAVIKAYTAVLESTHVGQNGRPTNAPAEEGIAWPNRLRHSG